MTLVSLRKALLLSTCGEIGPVRAKMILAIDFAWVKGGTSDQG